MDSDLEAAKSEVLEAESNYEKTQSEHKALKETLKAQQVREETNTAYVLTRMCRATIRAPKPS